MAHNHNSPYYQQPFVQQQQVPLQQQQTHPQYHTQYYQQPQNIFQQLGQPQPQAHLQRHSTYTAQQQQAPLQSHGYQYPQQQQLTQRPPSQIHPPFQPRQQQQPYPPPHTPFNQYSPTQPYTPQPPQAQPSYLAPQPPITRAPSSNFIPTSSFPPGTLGYANSPEAKQVSQIQTRPPVSPSATVAQQVQTQARTPAPQTPGRRPLPQPSGNTNTTPSALPKTPSLQRSTTLANRPPSIAANQFPQPIATSQSAQPQSTAISSPTRSRPLPTPNAAAGKRTTVDLGRISGLPSTSLNFANASNVSDSPTSVQTIKRVPSPMKSYQTHSSSSSMSVSNTGGTVSRTTSMAAGHLNDSNNDTTPKRRNSPPRFQTQPSSSTSSPTKEEPPKPVWNSRAAASHPSAGNNLPLNNAESPPKKFTPMWKRTIPDYPAPVFGYAAGMVSDPYTKPTQAAAALSESNVTTNANTANTTPKGKQQNQKKQVKDASPNSQSILPYLQPTPPRNHNPYPSSQAQPPPVPNRTQGHTRTPANYSRHQETEDDEDDGEQDDEDEEDDEEDDDDVTDEEIAYQYEGSDYSEESQPKTGRKRQRDIYGGGQVEVKKTTRGPANYDPPAPSPAKGPNKLKKSEGFVVVKTSKKLKGRGSPPRGSHERRNRVSEDDWEELQRRDIVGRREPSDRERVVRRKEEVSDDDEYEVKRRMGHRREHESSEGRRKSVYEEPREARRTSPTKGRAKDAAWTQEPAPQRHQREVSSRKVHIWQPDESEEDEDEGEEEDEPGYYGHQRNRSRPTSNRNNQERERASHGKGSGLPQPPAMMRGHRGREEEPPRKKKLMKPGRRSEEDDDEEFEARKLTSRFAAVKIDASRSTSRISGNPQADAWPVDLPRLPRTPGGSTPGYSSYNDSGGDYFSSRPLSEAHGPSKSSILNRGRPIKGEMSRETVRLKMDLDDSPPRSLRSPSPAPSASSSAYSHFSQSRPLPQPQRRQQDQQNEASDDQMRRRSMYSLPSQQQQQQPTPSKEQRRPQSQAYSTSSFNDIQDAPQRSQDFSNSRQFRRSPLPAFDNQPKMHLLNLNQNDAKRFQQQTPAPPPNINIESPAPVGGRDRMADIPKMEEDGHLEGGGDQKGRGQGFKDRGPSSRMQNNRSTSNVPHIRKPPSPPPSIPEISINTSPRMNHNVPMINISASMPSINEPSTSGPPKIQVYEIPGISVSGQEFEDDHHGGPQISVSGPNEGGGPRHQGPRPNLQYNSDRPARTGGLICGGCQGPIVGRIVSAMGIKWHPQCFRCSVCQELLEHVSSYEHEGRPYCHLDYHENFAPKCYSCKTSIIEEEFISLDDPALGKRTYHMEHFFCAECGDPFLTPSMARSNGGELALSGDGEFEGFTVYRGHPYCEACHVRLRLPKCKKCKKSIRDHDQAVEALGGKWCWACFVCDGCEKPFDDPSFFQRDNRPYCERCFSIILRNEM